MAQQLRTLGKIPQFLRRLARDTRGNTYFLVAAAMLPLIGMVGSGVDVGRAYMADLRLQQACDAGVLAGRRMMTGGTYTTANQTEATKMFNFNFQQDTYGSTNITFTSTQDGPSNVRGTASARVPTAIMQAFGQTRFDISVNCSAKLEISNVDVMFVLDVTGSMSNTNSGDSVNRITGLKNAVMNFFDTLTSAAVGDGRLRFGVVPYDTNINVGAALLAGNQNWLADEVTLPSRTPIYTTTWGTGTTTYGTPFDGATSWGSWSDNGGTIGGKNSTTCPQTTPPANSAPSATGSPWQVQTGQSVINGNLVTTYNNNQNYDYYNYQYVWKSNKCQRQRRTGTFTRTTPSTVTQPPIPIFSQYRYEDRIFDVDNFKTGGTVTYNVGDNGANYTATWEGCIIERQTSPFASNQTAPSDAYDMDIDMVPTSDPDTKWQIQVRQLAFERDQEAADLTTSDRDNTNVSDMTCPPAVMKLTTMTSTDRATFNTYIQALYPNGNTYHDFGLVWGARLLSPTGIFSSENTTAPNGRPIQRHLIFMTDGELVTNRSNLSLQGHEFTMQRVGSTSNTDGNARHTNRFLQLCESAKTKNITVWTVDFDTSLTPSLVTCASGSDKAMLAINSTQLNTQFQVIARQIARLRIHE